MISRERSRYGSGASRPPASNAPRSSASDAPGFAKLAYVTLEQSACLLVACRRLPSVGVSLAKLIANRPPQIRQARS